MIPAKYWSPTKRLMVLGAMAGGKLVEDTATGNPLVFTTDIAKPLKSLLIPFTPVQSGTGDPSPENVRPIVPWNGLKVFGGGKNILNPAYFAESSEFYSVENGTITAKKSDYRSWTNLPQIFLKAGKYTIKKSTAEGLMIVKTNLNDYGTSLVYAENVDSGTFTMSADGYIAIKPSENMQYPATFTLQLEVGQTATAYEPYVPVTDTDIVFPALGKNLLPESDVEYGSYGTTGGKIQNDNNKYRRLSIDLPVGNYVFSTDTPNCYFIRLLVNDSVVGTGGEVSSKAFTLTEASNVKIAWRNTDTSEISGTLHNQIELGSSASAYEPYKPITDTGIVFPSPVYGGTLDVVSGVLTVEWASADIGSFKYSLDKTLTGVDRFYINNFPNRKQNDETLSLYSDVFKWEKIGDANRNFDTWVVCPLNARMYYYVPAGTYETPSDFETAMSGKQIVYELATPQEITLTPEQITALKGDNTIWSDADRSMTAVYLKKG